MSSANGPAPPTDHASERTLLARRQTMELQLFESLVHHLIEKGLLTKNDALSVVQTVAEVKRGELETERSQSAFAEKELVILDRMYSSFEMIRERALVTQLLDGGNVLQLRPPLHGNHPKFPKDD